MKETERTWAEISLPALEHNYQILHDSIPGDCLFLATTKANAYGHGAERVALRLQVLGADYFSTATIDEALRLRECGIFMPILILGYTPPERAAELVEHELSQAVFSSEYADRLSEQLRGVDGPLTIHIKIDSGMSRLGFTAGDPAAPEAIAAICRRPEFYAEGIFTHFAVADAGDGEGYTMAQFVRFADLIAILRDQYQLSFEIRHCANSAAVVNYPCTHLDMVRAGISLYGCPPDPAMAGRCDLRPVMELKSRIIQIKDLPAGTSVSYGRTVTVDRARRVAVLPIGYADGLPRVNSNRFSVLLRGRLAPNVGRVCMDMCMIDVTEVPGARVGDEVTIFGRDPAPSADRFAQTAGTISYEIFCSVAARVPRVYLD